MKARVVSRGIWSVYGIPSPSFTTGSLGSRSSAGRAAVMAIHEMSQRLRGCVRSRGIRTAATTTRATVRPSTTTWPATSRRSPGGEQRRRQQEAESSQPGVSASPAEQQLGQGDRDCDAPDRMQRDQVGDPHPAQAEDAAELEQVEPRKSGLKNDGVISPSSSTPYASPSPRMVSQPRPVRRASSLTSTAPPPYRSASSRNTARKLVGLPSMSMGVLPARTSPTSGATNTRTAQGRKPLRSTGGRSTGLVCADSASEITSHASSSDSG